MTDFKTEFKRALKEEFAATEPQAKRVAEQAQRFLEDTGADETPDSIIQRMKKRQKNDLEGTWNATVGFMHGSTWDIGGEDGGDNPYQL